MDATLVAAICKQYGKRVGGGYEIFIPNSAVGQIPRTGQVQQLRDPEGLKLVYYPNITIEGEVVKPPESEPTSPPILEQPEPEPTPESQHIDEWA